MISLTASEHAVYNMSNDISPILIHVVKLIRLNCIPMQADKYIKDIVIV